MGEVIEFENQAPALSDKCMLKYFGTGDEILLCTHYPVACGDNSCAYRTRMDGIKRDLLNQGHNINEEPIDE